MINFSYSIQKFESEIQIKISNTQMELNLVMTESETIDLIENIQTADWDKRKSIKAGVCLNSNVFWCSNGNNISLLIGHDDETWDIGMIIPLEIINKIKIETGYNT